MLSWMLLGLIVGAALAASAWLGERALRAASLPARGVWLAALLGALALTATAPARRERPLVLTAVGSASGDMLPRKEAAAPGVLDRLRRAARAPMRIAARAGVWVPDRAVAAGWLVLSLTLGSIALATLRRARRARMAWPVRELAGVRVRVSPATGPAVLGVRRPEVVVPAWLLNSDAEEQRLVVLHESEHLRARDPAVMAAALGIALLLPWNPAVWWMVVRMRLALELDCDRRVLRGGVRPASYGALLLRVAGRGPALSLAVPAMAGSGTHLERRLKAMTNPIPRFAVLRAATLAFLGGGALLAACETRLPSTPEIEAMDARGAERRVGHMIFDTPEYVIDGRPATAAEAHALKPEEIARMEVRKTENGRGEVRITTLAATNGSLPRRQAGPGDVLVQVPAGESRERMEMSRFEGLILIDGVAATPSQASALDPNRIVSVEVTKGSAAAQHDDPRARNGVIRITTRPAP